MFWSEIESGFGENWATHPHQEFPGDLGDRASMVAAPRLWNSPPKELRTITNVNSFKAHIKTYLSDLFRTLYW